MNISVESIQADAINDWSKLNVAGAVQPIKGRVNRPRIQKAFSNNFDQRKDPWKSNLDANVEMRNKYGCIHLEVPAPPETNAPASCPGDLGVLDDLCIVSPMAYALNPGEDVTRIPILMEYHPVAWSFPNSKTFSTPPKNKNENKRIIAPKSPPQQDNWRKNAVAAPKRAAPRSVDPGQSKEIYANVSNDNGSQKNRGKANGPLLKNEVNGKAKSKSDDGSVHDGGSVGSSKGKDRKAKLMSKKPSTPSETHHHGDRSKLMSEKERRALMEKRLAKEMDEDHQKDWLNKYAEDNWKPVPPGSPTVMVLSGGHAHEVSAKIFDQPRHASSWSGPTDENLAGEFVPTPLDREQSAPTSGPFGSRQKKTRRKRSIRVKSNQSNP